MTEGRNSIVNAGVSAFGLQAKSQINVHRTVDTTLELELTPGSEYRLLWLADPSGVRWRIEG